MNTVAAIAILAALLAGPLLLAPLEHNLEPYCLVLGIIAVTLGGQWGWPLISHALLQSLPITLAVIVAGLLFGLLRWRLDRAFAALRRRLSRPLLVALTVLILGLASSVITAIVAALILVEGVGFLGLGPTERTRIVVLGCFGIGLGSVLTPLGEPLATLAAAALDLHFAGLFRLLSPWVIPGVVAVCAIAAYAARGGYDLIAETKAVHESPLDALIQGVKVFAFIVGLIFIGEACAVVAAHYFGMLSDETLYWANIVSAVLDNATLVAIEFHQITPARARAALLSLLVSGGMLIPGNVPNIVCAGKLELGTSEWARIGLPFGIALLGIYFAIWRFTR